MTCLCLRRGMKGNGKARWLLPFLPLVIILAIVYTYIRPTPDPVPLPPSGSEAKFKDFFSQQIGRNNNIRTNSRGFWSGTDARHYHAKNYSPGLLPRLLAFFRKEGATSVLDMGGGGGQQTLNLIQNGIFGTCVDGNPDAQEVSEGVCTTADLTQPLRIAPHDWVVSISVGRQIPPNLESVFLANIHRLNRVGVVIYWGDGRPATDERTKSKRNNTQVTANFTRTDCYDMDVRAAESLYGSGGPSDVGYSFLVFRKRAKCIGKELKPPPYTGISLAIVSCGPNRTQETITLLKSAILFTQHTRLRVFLFTDADQLQNLQSQVEKLAKDAGNQGLPFAYQVLLATFPPEEKGMVAWGKIFKPCSLLRLFLPSLLPEVDSILYMDADSLILANLTQLWGEFAQMNSSQLIALSPITQPQMASWFTKTKTPHYGAQGLNCGIAAMNLTRMRQVGFQDLIQEVRKNTESVRPNNTGDQFLQNILYSQHPEFVKEFDCAWNLRPLHCFCSKQTSCGCPSALDKGVGIIHGTEEAFTNKDRLPFYAHIYKRFSKHKLGRDSFASLVGGLKTKFEDDAGLKRCFFNSSDQFFARTQEYLNALQI